MPWTRIKWQSSAGIQTSFKHFYSPAYFLFRDVPYSASFILDLPAQVEPNLRNVIDFVFLPGFNNPTLAILYQTQQTWTGYAHPIPMYALG